MSAEDWELLEDACAGWPVPNLYTAALARLRERMEALIRLEGAVHGWWSCDEHVQNCCADWCRKCQEGERRQRALDDALAALDALTTTQETGDE